MTPRSERRACRLTFYFTATSIKLIFKCSGFIIMSNPRTELWHLITCHQPVIMRFRIILKSLSQSVSQSSDCRGEVSPSRAARWESPRRCFGTWGPWWPPPSPPEAAWGWGRTPRPGSLPSSSSAYCGPPLCDTEIYIHTSSLLIATTSAPSRGGSPR